MTPVDRMLGCSSTVGTTEIRRCIHETTPDDFGPVRSLGINGPRRQCRGVPQKELRACTCLRSTGARRLHMRAQDQTLRPQLQAADIVPLQAADIVPQEGRNNRSLRDACLQRTFTSLLLRACGLPHRFPPDFGAALTLVAPVQTRAATIHSEQVGRAGSASLQRPIGML